MAEVPWYATWLNDWLIHTVQRQRLCSCGRKTSQTVCCNFLTAKRVAGNITTVQHTCTIFGCYTYCWQQCCIAVWLRHTWSANTSWEYFRPMLYSLGIAFAQPLIPPCRIYGTLAIFRKCCEVMGFDSFFQTIVSLALPSVKLRGRAILLDLALCLSAGTFPLCGTPPFVDLRRKIVLALSGHSLPNKIRRKAEHRRKISMCTDSLMLLRTAVVSFCTIVSVCAGFLSQISHKIVNLLKIVQWDT